MFDVWYSTTCTTTIDNSQSQQFTETISWLFHVDTHLFFFVFFLQNISTYLHLPNLFVPHHSYLCLNKKIV